MEIMQLGRVVLRSKGPKSPLLIWRVATYLADVLLVACY